ncbi:MAG: tetratricopeptide repeat protein [Bacteroidales bacterium]
MKKILILILLSITSVLFVNANQAKQMLDSANQAYVDGNYTIAIDTYEKVLELGYESAALYYNLGNAYYKQNIIDQAILNYERALLLKPNDEDIIYNLEMANRLIVDRIEKLPVFFITNWIKNMINLFSSDLWAIISIISFLAALFFISIYMYTRWYGVKKTAFWLGFATILICISSFIFSYKQKQKIVDNTTAIVMSPSVTVKSSPDISGTDLFVIHEGTKVWIQDKIGIWKQIRLSDGSKGWLKTESIEEI